MIPRKIHYCWFGHTPIPEMAQRCIASWHKHMPEWEYCLWNEENFDIDSHRYSREAYATGHYAFVSDVARLAALSTEGGVYMDVDFEVFRPFDSLLNDKAFAGFEGSKRHPVMMGVCGSEPHSQWIDEMLATYQDLPFLVNNQPDLTPNVTRLTALMQQRGLSLDGREQYYRDLHIYPVDYFCPRQTTGEYFRTANTYCDHRGLNSWSGQPKGWKRWLHLLAGQRGMTFLIKTKRRLER